MSRPPLPQLTVGEELDLPPRVRVDRKLGSGAFGAVYAVTGKAGRSLALKVEAASPRFSQLALEKKIMDQLEARGVRRVPRCHAFVAGTGGKPSLLLMDLLGRSLEDVKAGGRLALRDVVVVAIRSLDRLRDFHRCGLVHRDIKPQNLLLSGGDPQRTDVALIDFGLTKAYLDAGGKHVAYREGRSGLTGTPRFASRWMMRGIESSRRDDLEGLLYSCCYLFHGSLPWQKVRLPRSLDPKSAEGRQRRNELILAAKDKATTTLTDAMGPAFQYMASHVASLRFDARPDYEGLRRRFVDSYRSLRRRGHEAAADGGGADDELHVGRTEAHR